ncbi:putative tRNA (cytidine(32)/guanosine(34)-2'-O)-methyltransferase [Trichinella pseudospiralis]|uniref:Putative tRNA (cytidine(32)/guanosine(34)-2'-O)-methyltransferase n=2 Tax=Trichinella pseudospiralis TaxID=6337 RepID=A0A0V1FYJ7_TRIPS|nr:putative tRNA (cytidine(32)/guanosine(34)-2'-O)-methyltransferase [Trichinella pseudospiralis]KRY71729.1 putative tRNA (cytidine(32)/guanosine(34)-2'-O)-methyltransferase [Trichinella pseudospiralis]KRY90924.1 putative tRNA (cytidine(32)/guanosine(34)-2'-O)-methyltransferase [Trichinella pseudospiralis]KRZ27961.1 putative tRNA (cytidine(32)/guanosine(34)-2'-O)-methyltransferase [Trichinella pseudospiralis]KRZ42385.1 putative tRNA (cytidine(32)/guanosine(34)-2'-O)-methyltransferase [Trichinel
MGKCSKDKRDVFYRLSKEEEYRARSSFKLKQINEEFGILKGVRRAVDLCAAPGSWSQVIREEINKSSYKDSSVVIAVDIQEMAPLEGVMMLQADITEKETAAKIKRLLPFGSADIVVCDGAPDVTGIHDLDEFLQGQLLVSALNIATMVLKNGGTFVSKIFRAKHPDLLITQLKIFFNKVEYVKPRSSRGSSYESFVVCQGLTLPLGYQPTTVNLMLEPNYDLAVSKLKGVNRQIVPFVSCGDLSGWDSDMSFSLRTINDISTMRKKSLALRHTSERQSSGKDKMKVAGTSGKTTKNTKRNSGASNTELEGENENLTLDDAIELITACILSDV